MNLKYIFFTGNIFWNLKLNLPRRAKKNFICFIFGSVSVNTAKDGLATGETYPYRSGFGSARFVPFRWHPYSFVGHTEGFFWIGLNRARLEFFEPRALKWNIFLNENVICGAKKNKKFEFVSIWTIVRSFMLWVGVSPSVLSFVMLASLEGCEVPVGI